LRVAFAGTPPFAATALAALDRAGHEVVLVLTQPDRPAGRGLKLASSAVAQWAEGRGLPLHKPRTLKAAEAEDAIRAVRPDVMVVAAYGLLLPAAVLRIPPHGCLNIHASLLPRWRGAAPIQRAILAGDAQTGISIMCMDAGLDTGPVLLQKPLAIGSRETAGTLTQALSVLGAEAIAEALGRLPQLEPRQQDAASATYAAKVAKAEARIDWSLPNEAVDRQVRAFNPVPGAETLFRGEILKVWEADPAAGIGAPGTVLEAENGRIRVACGVGSLILRTLQRAGGRRLDAAGYLRGTDLASGAVLGQKPLASA
jgi:methionyl-tRNA formyltransferase